MANPELKNMAKRKFNAVNKKLNKKTTAPHIDTSTKSSFSDFGGDIFTLDHVRSPLGGHQVIHEYLRKTEERNREIEQYNLMEKEIPECSSALDLITDSVVFGQDASAENNEETYKLLITTKDGSEVPRDIIELQKEIDQTSGIHDRQRSQIRSALKYGDSIDQILWNEDGDCIGFKHMPIKTMEINMDAFGRINPDKAYYQRHPGTGEVIDTWPKNGILHYSNKVDIECDLKWGRSVYWGAVRIWRQLVLMEESLCISRLKRGSTRYAYMIDVGKLPPADAKKYVEQYENKLKRKKSINPSTGKYRIEETPLLAEDDVFLPVRQGSAADIKPLIGSSATERLDDVYYFYDKLFTAMRTPRAYLSSAGTRNLSSGVLEAQDVAFIKQARDVQRNAARTTSHFYRVCYEMKNVDTSNLIFTVKYPVSGTIDEMRRWQIMSLKANIARTFFVDVPILTDTFIYKNILQLNDDEIAKMKKEIEDSLPEPGEVEFDPQDPNAVSKTPNQQAPEDNPNKSGGQASARQGTLKPEQKQFIKEVFGEMIKDPKIAEQLNQALYLNAELNS